MTKTPPLLRHTPLLAAVAALALPTAASAAPDRNFTMTSAAAAAAWDGPAAVGSYNPAGDYAVENCSKDAATYCDQTLVHIQSGSPVTLDVSIGAYSMPFADFDLYVYKSNANGTATEEDDLTESTTGPVPSTGLPNGFEENTSIPDLPAGYYLVNVVYYTTTSAGSSYHADASITGATPGGGGTGGGGTDPGTGGGGGGGGSTPPPSGQPAPAPAPGATALPFKAASAIGSAKKAKKSRKLAFTATADQDISGLTVQLLSGKAGTKQKVVASFKAATFAKGARKITLKLSKKVAKKLKKGKYTLAARGTVNGQAQQATQAVTIKK